MNDEHREAALGNGKSSNTDASGTATAEPVDRRWFEDALRAQGFLVEAPAAPEPAGFEWLGPLAEPEPDLEPVALPVASTEPEAPPQDVEADPVPVATTGRSDTQPWDFALPPPVEVPATPSTTWPVMRGSPARITTNPTTVVATAVVASATRQPVAPTTLSSAVPPVPTAALAARLSRGLVAAPGEAQVKTPVAALVETQVATAETADAPAAAAVAPAITPGPIESPDPLALLTSQVDLETEPLGWAATPTVLEPRDPIEPQDLVEPSDMAVAAGVGTAVIGDASFVVVDASSAEVTARAEADLQTQVDQAVVPEVSDLDETPAGTEVLAASRTVAETTQATVASPADTDAIAPIITAAAFSVAAAPPSPPAPATSSIAGATPRTPSVMVGTTVDGGESDLWGLVGDPRKAATPVGTPVAASRSSRLATIALTVIVAFVVVSLVLGFLFLLTDLL